MVNPGYKKISPTAKLVAEMRRYSDIPYAAAIADRIGSAEATFELLGEKPAPELLQTFAPYAEIRYKSLQQGILRSKVKQVVELASGFSFRGAAMTENSDLLYIETDLPEMHDTRTKLRAELEAARIIPQRENLKFLPLDIMNEEQWEALERALRPGEPVAIVHEGLFQYFGMDEKAAAAEKIARLLRRHGGVWITPDLQSISEQREHTELHPQYARLLKAISTATARDLSENAFPDQASAEKFFRQLGFHTHVQLQVDGSFCLSSANRLNSAAEQLHDIKQNQLWELTVRA